MNYQDALSALAPWGTIAVSLLLGWIGYRRASKSDTRSSYRDLLDDYRTEVALQKDEIARQKAEIAQHQDSISSLETNLASLQGQVELVTRLGTEREAWLRGRLSEVEQERDHANMLLVTLQERLQRYRRVYGDLPERRHDDSLSTSDPQAVDSPVDEGPQTGQSESM